MARLHDLPRFAGCGSPIRIENLTERAGFGIKKATVEQLAQSHQHGCRLGRSSDLIEREKRLKKVHVRILKHFTAIRQT
jgi:hypothetical protein